MSLVVDGQRSFRMGCSMVEVGHMAAHTELAVVVYSELTSLHSETAGHRKVHCPRMVTERR